MGVTSLTARCVFVRSPDPFVVEMAAAFASVAPVSSDLVDRLLLMSSLEIFSDAVA